MYEDGVFYVLPRKDMDSLNHAGKMAAQVAHAAHHAADQIQQAAFGPENRTAWMNWEKSTEQGFGTTIVLGSLRADLGPVPLTMDRICGVVAGAKLMGYAAGIVHDPSYPLQDGQVTHLIPIDTCGWMFGSKLGLEPILRYLGLHGESAKPTT